MIFTIGHHRKGECPNTTGVPQKVHITPISSQRNNPPLFPVSLQSTSILSFLIQRTIIWDNALFQIRGSFRFLQIYATKWDQYRTCIYGKKIGIVWCWRKINYRVSTNTSNRINQYILLQFIMMITELGGFIGCFVGMAFMSIYEILENFFIALLYRSGRNIAMEQFTTKRLK